MNVFQTAKTVSAADVARLLGLKESHGRFQCPFHDDHHPSMACYEKDKRFYCFACMARGDATDLWAKVMDTTPRMAAEAVCKAFGLEVTPDFVKADVVRGGANGPRWDPRQNAEEARRKKRIDDVAMLPEKVWVAWQQGMVKVLEAELDACTALFEDSPDPDGWRWQAAFRRASRLHDELNRFRSIPAKDLAAEAAMRREDPRAAAALPGQLELTETVLRHILQEELRGAGMELSAEERAYVCRTLQISPEEA